MPKFRKKPVIIEAYQWTSCNRENPDDWPQWLHDAFCKGAQDDSMFLYFDQSTGKRAGHINTINTLEGNHIISDCDWIIQGIAGELYACKPDKFDLTYDPA